MLTRCANNVNTIFQKYVYRPRNNCSVDGDKMLQIAILQGYCIYDMVKSGAVQVDGFFYVRIYKVGGDDGR